MYVSCLHSGVEMRCNNKICINVFIYVCIVYKLIFNMIKKNKHEIFHVKGASKNGYYESTLAWMISK